MPRVLLGATRSRSACGDDERPPAAACVDDGELGGVAKVAVVVGAIVFVFAAAVGLALAAGADAIDDDPP